MLLTDLHLLKRCQISNYFHPSPEVLHCPFCLPTPVIALQLFPNLPRGRWETFLCDERDMSSSVDMWLEHMKVTSHDQKIWSAEITWHNSFLILYLYSLALCSQSLYTSTNIVHITSDRKLFVTSEGKLHFLNIICWRPPLTFHWEVHLSHLYLFRRRDKKEN